MLIALDIKHMPVAYDPPDILLLDSQQLPEQLHTLVAQAINVDSLWSLYDVYAYSISLLISYEKGEQPTLVSSKHKEVINLSTLTRHARLRPQYQLAFLGDVNDFVC